MQDEDREATRSSAVGSRPSLTLNGMPHLSGHLRKFVAAAAALIVFSVIGAAAFVFSGVYDISATEQHTPPVYWVIEATMRRSVHAHASGVALPEVSSDALKRGFTLYHAQCERCHGGPGVAPEKFALGMTPAPANLTDTAQRWTAVDIYWVIKHGIKMTGMPAWKYRMSEDDIRFVAAFVHQRLRQLSPADYSRLLRESRDVQATRSEQAASDLSARVAQGKQAIQQYACATCHEIPGITGATKAVGPPLRGIATRSFIAGVLRNTPENMVKWLMSPPRIDALTAMPDLGVTETDARAMAAYLATLAP